MKSKHTFFVSSKYERTYQTKQKNTSKTQNRINYAFCLVQFGKLKAKHFANAHTHTHTISVWCFESIFTHFSYHLIDDMKIYFAKSEIDTRNSGNIEWNGNEKPFHVFPMCVYYAIETDWKFT